MKKHVGGVSGHQIALRRGLGLMAVAAVGSLVAAADAPAPSPLAGARLYADPSSDALAQSAEWRRSRPDDAALMERMGRQPVAKWFGDWNRDVRGDVAAAAARAAKFGAIPVFVAYNIPQRDCGSHSAGGARTADGYRAWIREFAAGLRGQRALVVLEPDAVAGMDCLGAASRAGRLALLADAVSVLKRNAETLVYIDAGHSRWISGADMAGRLKRAGIAQADGFALNVSNFQTTASNLRYGEDLSRRVGGKHFVIDTSRNGVGAPADGEWCNPEGRALGAAPGTRTGHALVDALLWIKTPGESDGTCNGGPRAGQWWPEYALGLARRAPAAVASSR